MNDMLKHIFSFTYCVALALVFLAVLRTGGWLSAGILALLFAGISYLNRARFQFWRGKGLFFRQSPSHPCEDETER
ncbi:hypothetical protein H7J86_09685 [Mycobacterium hackensackense]|uniref:hypothetical protein n=1 Tax=Mycobacterium hackensackense TaxID=228909 RepID=UPI002265C626|nr:hypothetical protein [Mycobacterium hackensackense]MCV7252432.1 hypothetical protein [Mycobacterium hackensackense]